jgi:tetratricopeptide (TPR) repeat protein
MGCCKGPILALGLLLVAAPASAQTPAGASAPAAAGVSASAQAPAGASAPADADYDAEIAAALQEYQRGNWTEAIALFKRAHRLQPSARTHRRLGLTHFEARRYALALEHLEAALSCARDIESDRSDGKSLQTVSGVLLAAGVASVADAAVWWLVDRDVEQPAAPAASAACDGTGCHASARVRFSCNVHGRCHGLPRRRAHDLRAGLVSRRILLRHGGPSATRHVV